MAPTVAEASTYAVPNREKPQNQETYIPMDLKGYRHLFDPYTSWKWEFPNAYRKPAFGYQKLARHRHRDVFEREWVGDYDDRK
jgi:hypothetical protein